MTVASPPLASAGRAFSQELTPEGILVLTLDVPGEKLNTLGKAMMQELYGLLGEIEARPDVRAIVLRSAKADNFIAGADIKDFTTIRSSLEGESLSRQGQGILDRLEALKVPVVAAIHGSCMGGGLETALACRYRIASDHPRTSIGLPEVNLGIIPGMGGTQRLPRLVGLRTALDLILTGRALKASRALKAGVVDEVVPPAILLETARRAAGKLADGSLVPKRPGIPLVERLMRPVIFSKARQGVQAKTHGHYPAPVAAIEVVEKGTATTLEEGLKLEARRFGELSVTEVSRALVSVFFATQEIKKDGGYPQDTQAREVHKLAVVGAGLMGAGIAAGGADAGVPVRLKDTTLEALARGLRYVREVFDERVKRRSLSRYEFAARMNRLTASLDYAGFRRADLVIEAVFEDLELKRRVRAEVEAATGEDCVFASNTSSLPIGDIAKGARRPTRILGMHFFSPVQKMPLLEVIVTPQTDAWATATAVQFGRRMGKHVIVVRDGPGFYTSRALAPYMNEAARLVEEGVPIEDVDRAMVDFGFPVGPVTLLDEVGIDVGAKVSKILHHAFGERMTPPESMARVIEDGRLGRKNKRGFYLYDEAGKKQGVDASVYALLPGGGARKAVEPREIQERLVFAFLNEAALCLQPQTHDGGRGLQEGILRSPRDGDVGAIFGLGFPPFLGGPFRYLDHLGARFAVEVLERLRAKHGERFAPAPLLVERAREGRTFY
jgi:3-hydroxyacyl-CoA dehydrogenase / enoyl-CoA hydratase / 3-hydroxybutyryl-CoA epimerase